MKKLLLLLSAAVVGTTAFAQANLQKVKVEEFKGFNKTALSAEEFSTPVRHNSNARSANVNVIWEDDFSNGLQWTNRGGVNGTTNPQPIWEYRGTNTTPDTATGTRGAYGLNRRINSLTWENGFVIFDSDYLDNGGVAGAFGQGAVPAPHYGELISPAFDLTGIPDVQLEFYQFYRNFNAITAVVLSGDGGLTWNDTLYVNTGVATNALTADDDYQILDVSPVAGNSSQFQFKFIFLDDGGAYYFWQIDDVRLIQKPDNDLAILPDFENANGLFKSQPVLGTRDLDYGFIPLSQLEDVGFQTLVENLGAVDQTGTVVNYSVTGPVTYNQNSAADTIPTNNIFILDNSTAAAFSPTNIGLYEVTMSVSSDSVDRDPDPFRPSNNSYTTEFTISDSTYGIARQASTSRLGTTSFNNGADGIRFGNLIEVIQDDELTSVTIGLSVITQPGATAFVTVRDTLPGFVGNVQSDFPNILLESDFYTVTAQDSINGFITIPIPEVINGAPQDRLLPADWYIVSVELYSSGNSFDIAILDDGATIQPWYASIFYYPPQQRWYSNGNSMHIWANFGQTSTIGIEEKPEVDFSLAPNPAKDAVTLNVAAAQATDFHVVITNISGQVQKSMVYNNTDYINDNISLSDLSAGIYMVQIHANNNVVTQKLVVTK